MRRQSGFHWTTKPYVGSELNRAHPLAASLTAAFLLNEGTGNRVYDLTGQYSAAPSSALVWSANTRGSCLNIAATNNRVPVTATIAIPAVPVTLVASGQSAISGPNGLYIAGLGLTTTVALDTNASGTQRAFYNGTSATSTVAMDTLPHMWALTNDGTTGGLKLYQDGKQVQTATKALTSFTAVALGIGGNGNGTGGWNGTIDQEMLWIGRALTGADIAQLYADPWCFVLPPPSRR